MGAGAGARGCARRAGAARWRVSLRQHRRADARCSSRRSCRSPRAPTTRSSISDSDATALLTSLLVRRRSSRCRWRRTSPASTAPIRAPRTASWRRSRTRRIAGRRSPRCRPGSAPGSTITSGSGRAGALVRREPPVRARRLAVGGGRQGSDGWFFYARRQGGRGLRERRAADRRGDRELARGGRSRARDWLQARGIAYVFTIAPDKHVIYPDEMPPTIARVGDAVARRSGVHRAAGHRARGRRAAGAVRRARRASGSTSRPTRTGTTAARSSPISRSSTRSARSVPSTPPAWTRDDFDADRAHDRRAGSRRHDGADARAARGRPDAGAEAAAPRARRRAGRRRRRPPRKDGSSPRSTIRRCRAR